ncbi:MAG TPA: M56 family metallopeptidase, partial [Novosphingobium sp.]|nr:M56 family metallopeptidase [Novosphingobium sp.]
MQTVALLIELAWKSTLIAGGALAVLRMLRARSPAERSLIAHLALCALLVLPAAALLLPTWAPSAATFEAPSIAAGLLEVKASAPLAVTPQPPAAAEASARASAADIAGAVYLFPAALLLLAMLVAIVRLFAMRTRANVIVEAPWLAALAGAQRRMGFKHGTALLVSDELRSPISWGVMRPIILLDRKAVEASGEAEAIIAHELAHVARLDWAKLLIARLACALLWFNPLVWRLARESHQLREETADDAVLLSAVDGADYAALLVSAARHDNKALLLAAHGVAPAPHSLKRRITRVLDNGLARTPATAGWAALCVVVLGGIAAPLAALDPLAARATFAASPLERSHGGIAATVRDGLTFAATALGAKSADDTPAPARTRRLTPGELTQMRAIGVTPEYVAALDDAGFPRPSLGEITQAKALGVTAAYAAAMRRAYPNASLGEIAQARAMGIEAEELGELRAAYPGADLNGLAQARAIGLSPAYTREMRRIFPSVSMNELAGMRAVGVTPEYVRRLQAATRDDVTPSDAIQQRALGHADQALSRAELAEIGAEVSADVREALAAARAEARAADRDNDVDDAPDVDID